MLLFGADRMAQFLHYFTGRTRTNLSTIDALKDHCDLRLLPPFRESEAFRRRKAPYEIYPREN